MNKFLISTAALTVAAAAFGQGVQYSEVPNSLRHPDALAQLPTPVPATQAVHFAISLQPRDPLGLQNFVNAVSDPASPLFRKFITPAQVGAQYGPLPADVNAVKTFLTSQGLTISSVATNSLVIIADGTAKQVSAAFRTSLGDVPRVDIKGKAGFYRTNVTPLYMPASMAEKVVSIDGIDTSIQFKSRATTTTLNPPLFRSFYQAAAGYSAGFYGQGVRIGISNWDGYRLSNIPLLVNAFNLPVPAAGAGSNIIVQEVGTGATDGQGATQGEGDLDIQAVLATSPLATVYDYDDAQSDTALPISTLSKIVSDNLVDICTESYGWETSDGNVSFGQTWTAAHNLHLSMSAQGITYMAASGDDGTENFPASGARLSYPDMDPDVMMVGGSEATVNTTTGARVSEVPWGLSNGWGGTGGFDPYDVPATGFAFNVPPPYQTKAIPNIVKAYPYRVLPDTVSSAGGQDGLGNNDGSGWAYVTFIGGALEPIDGTSIASPATAGGLGAIESQLFAKVTPNATRSNVRLGRLMDFLYSIGNNPAVFNDITTGSSVGNLPGTSIPDFPTVGWDMATGWGSFNYSGLLAYLRGSAFTTVVDGKALQSGPTKAAYGTYLNGLLNGVGSTYNIESALVAGIGQVAGTEIDFTAAIPSGYAVSAATLTIAAKAVSGSTNQLYFWNYQTKGWDYSEANPMFGTTVSGTYTLTTSKYVGPGNNVRVMARAVLPSHISNNPFIYSLSTATVQFGALPTN